MESSKTTLKAALRSWAAESGQALGDHPSLETLVAYHEGELTEAAEIERLQDHLVLCADCAALLVDLADFESPETPATPATPELLSDGDVAAAWRRISPLVTAAPAPVADNVLRMPPVPPPSQEAAPRRRSWQTWALAASFLFVVGVSAWALLLLGENRALRQPFIAENSLSLEVTRGLSTVAPLSVSKGVVLDLPSDAVKVEIVADGAPERVVWRTDVHRLPNGGVTVALHPGSVPPGLYTIRTYSGQGQPVERRVEFTAP